MSDCGWKRSWVNIQNCEKTEGLWGKSLLKMGVKRGRGRGGMQILVGVHVTEATAEVSRNSSPTTSRLQRIPRVQ